MRHILLAAVIMCGFTFGQGVHYWISHADENSMEISISNDVPVFGFQLMIDAEPQFNMILTGIQPATLLENAGLTVSMNPSNMIMAYSTIGQAIPPGEGVLMTLTWNIEPVIGWITLLSNDEVSDEYWMSLCNYESYTPGDVNDDGVSDILDIVLAVAIIMGQEEPLQYQLCSFDFNNDGENNILDIVLGINGIWFQGE